MSAEQQRPTPPSTQPAANQNKRCQTCKERKIKCDGAQPVCRNCQKSRRECRAADKFALSWPDRKSRRFLEGPRDRRRYLEVTRGREEGGDQVYHFVNVYFDYAQAHYLLPYAANSRGIRSMLFDRTHHFPDEFSIFQQNIVRQPQSLYGDTEKFRTGDSDWISYFFHETASSLPLIDNKPTEIRDLLLRMSLHDDSQSSRAVLYAIFCLAAIRRYGNAQESVHFKSLALKALQDSAQAEPMTLAKTLQHVAAGLVLCRAEIALGDDSTVFWGLYICNLRTIFNNTFTVSPSKYVTEEADATILFRYVLYHEVLSKFSLGHWRRPSIIFNQMKVAFKDSVLEFNCRYPLHPVYGYDLGDYMQTEMLLLSQILDVSKVDHHGPCSSYEKPQQPSEDELERSLTTSLRRSRDVCKAMFKREESTPEDAAEDIETASSPTMALELQKLLFLAGCWIYFMRTCRQLTGPSTAVEELLDEIFALGPEIVRLGVRVMPFSMFMIGSEANNEDRRRHILDLTRATIVSPVSCGYSSPPAQLRLGMAHSECLLSAVWAQDDLMDPSQGYLDYVTKMQWVVTARPILPALV